jgi:hypothetical protein
MAIWHSLKLNAQISRRVGKQNISPRIAVANFSAGIGVFASCQYLPRCALARTGRSPDQSGPTWAKRANLIYGMVRSQDCCRDLLAFWQLY